MTAITVQAGAYLAKPLLATGYDQPDDYVSATGVEYTVREFLEVSSSHVGLDSQDYVRFDDRYLRPAEVDASNGDHSRARTELGWILTINGLQLARLRVDADVTALGHEGKVCIDPVRLDSSTLRHHLALGVGV